jgi:maleylacetoacetate isomerase/maleylpyruvate isomerase
LARTLYGYWRSTAAYRVRIALAWKGLAYEPVAIDLRGGEQSSLAYRSVNPQGFVPFLVDGDVNLGQSLAIMEYLEEVYPDRPLLPANAVDRAKVRAMAQVVACDIHPINNLRVLKYLARPLELDQPKIEIWARNWIDSGFAALETQASASGPYIYGDSVTLADVCLVPQLYNARRVFTDLSKYPRLLAVDRNLDTLPAFRDARPEAQREASK